MSSSGWPRTHCWKCRPPHGSSRWAGCSAGSPRSPTPSMRELYRAEHAALTGSSAKPHPAECRTKRLVRGRKVVAGRRVGPAATTTTVPPLHLAVGADLRIRRTPPSEDTERNEFHASRTLNGRVSVKGDLDRRHRRDAPDRTVRADQTTESSRRPRRKTHPGTSASRCLRRDPAPLPRLGDAPTEGGERPHLSLHVNAADLARSEAAHEWVNPDDDSDLFGDKDIARLPHTGPLSIATARRLACDCHLTPIVMTTPLNLGRSSRTVSKKQRRALIARDPRLRPSPVRHTTRHCEGHHVKHWADGAPPTSTTSSYSAATTTPLACHHSHWDVKIGRRPAPVVHPTEHRRPLQETHPRPQPRRTTRRMTRQPAPETGCRAIAG